MQQLVNQNTKSPNIRLRTIHVINITLRRHVNRRTNVDVLKLRTSHLRKPKVSNLSLPVVNKNITDLDISMHNPILSQIHQSFINPPHIRLSFLLLHVLFIPQFRLQIALVTNLSDNIAIPLTRKDLMAFQYVRMIQFLQNLNLRKKQFLQFLTLQRIQLDNLNSHRLVCIGN